MKRILLLFLAVLFIAGCVNLPWGAPRDELEMVPQAANALLIFKPSSTLNDSDFASLYNSSEQMSFEISRIEATTGIDPAKIDRMVLFFNFDSFTQESETYGGFVASGVIEKENILEKMKLNNIITELKYGSSTIYEITSRELPENKTYLSFLGGMLVGGSRKAVEDSIDLSNGKGASVKSRKNLMKAYDELGKDSVFLFLMESTPQMRKEINETQQQLFSIRPLSRMQSVGFSIEKKGKAVDLKLLTLADDAASAADISDLFKSLVSIAKGLSNDGSIAKTVLSKINVQPTGDGVSVSLSSNVDELSKLNEEIGQLPASQASDDERLQEAQQAATSIAASADIVGAQGYPANMSIRVSMPADVESASVGSPNGIGKEIILNIGTASGIKQVSATTMKDIAGNLSKLTEPGIHFVRIYAQDKCTKDISRECVYIEAT